MTEEDASPLWCRNNDAHAPHSARNEFSGVNYCTGRPVVNGSCWDSAPSFGHDPMPKRCELMAGHLGAHRGSGAEWMHSSQLPQGEPSDAQVLAAVDAFMASQLESEEGPSLVHKNMAAALRAAFEVS